MRIETNHTLANMKEIARIVMGILTSPLAIIWLLITDRHSRLLPVCVCYLFAPLAIAWHYLTHRELTVQIRSFSYHLQANSFGRGVTFSNFVWGAIRSDGSALSEAERRKLLATWRPRQQFGPVVISLHQPHREEGEDRPHFGEVKIRLFAKCPENYPPGKLPQDYFASHMATVSFGKINISIRRCED